MPVKSGVSPRYKRPADQPCRPRMVGAISAETGRCQPRECRTSGLDPTLCSTREQETRQRFSLALHIIDVHFVELAPSWPWIVGAQMTKPRRSWQLRDARTHFSTLVD